QRPSIADNSARSSFFKQSTGSLYRRPLNTSFLRRPFQATLTPIPSKQLVNTLATHDSNSNCNFYSSARLRNLNYKNNCVTQFKKLVFRAISVYAPKTVGVPNALVRFMF